MAKTEKKTKAVELTKEQRRVLTSDILKKKKVMERVARACDDIEYDGPDEKNILTALDDKNLIREANNVDKALAKVSAVVQPVLNGW